MATHSVVETEKLVDFSKGIALKMPPTAPESSGGFVTPTLDLKGSAMTEANEALKPLEIVLMAPVNPPAIAAFLSPANAEVARQADGNYGTAPSALVGALIEAGHRVTVVSHRRGHPALTLSGPSLRFIQVASRPSARHQVLDMWKLERKAMVAAASAAQADVIHAHWTYEWALAALDVPGRLPTIISVRDAPLTVLRYHRDLYRLLRTMLAFRVRLRAGRALLTANSPYMARAWARQMLDVRPITVIPNITPRDFGPPAARSENPVLVEVADAGARKNIKVLLKAFSLVHSQRPDVELRLLGAGLGESDPIAEWARARGLGGGVSFVGVVSRAEVFTHLSQAWVHVHAALEESFGNTLVEAMKVSTAVVGGRRSGAVPWVLDSGRAGMLSDVSSATALSVDILALLDNAEMRNTLAEAGRNRVETMYSAAAVADQHITLYRKLLADRSAG